MPGTIQVSVLELVELPSILQSSSMGIRVSVGKKSHEARDKGDFSFPLASLRENLNVSIHDSEGNEIANTVVETRSIVERGIWDDSFALNGGGRVRMRLHFILTEDELKRIRSMRESVTRKKQEDLLKRSHSSSDLAVASGGSPASSQDSPRTAHQAEEQRVNFADHQASKTYAGSDDKVFSKAPPSQKKQPFSTSKSTGALDKLQHRRVKEVVQTQEQEHQSPSGKTPRNVRKMILAFESDPVKEAQPASNKTRPTPQLSSNATSDAPSQAPSLKKNVAVIANSVLSNSEMEPAPSIPRGTPTGTGRIKDNAYPREEFGEKTKQLKDLRISSVDKMPNKVNMRIVEKIKQLKELSVNSVDQFPSKVNVTKVQPAKEENKEEEKSPKKLRRSSTSEISKFNREELLRAFPSKKRPFIDFFAEQKEAPSHDALVLGNKWRSKHWKSSQLRGNSKVRHENEHSSSDGSRGWIFLEEVVFSCIPSDDRPFVEDLIEGRPCSPDISERKLADAMANEDDKDSVQPREAEHVSKPNNRAPEKPIGQAIKIAIMVGFGLLVFLTRQRR